MIIPNLHRKPEPLDNQKHRELRLAFPMTDWSVAARLNGIFVAAAEFTDASREYPIVFVRAGREADGREQIAPIAVLGVMPEQNLFVDGADGKRWRATYKPAVLQAYPFCIGRVDETRSAVCVDMDWSGIGTGASQGRPLFDGTGEPAELLKAMQKHLELLDREIQATRSLGRRLLELELLRDMRFDASLPDGRKHTVDGFLVVDSEKAQSLPNKTVVELHRNGMLGLMQLHWASLGLMGRLMEWHVQRSQGAVPAAPAAAGAESVSAPAA